MSILYGITCVVGIIFMIVLMFIGIWLFIIALKAYKQLRYKNYILEKINQKLEVSHKTSPTSENTFTEETTNSNNFDEDLNCSNVCNFDKLDKKY